MEAPEWVCESCARDDDDLVLVHRIYIELGGEGEENRSTVIQQPELWCFTCRSMYPHRVADQHKH